MSRIRLRHPRLIAAAALTVLPAILPAQASVAADTLKACYIPSTGTVYRIATASAPAACTKSTHIPFSWVDAKGALRIGGPAPAAGQVLTFKSGFWQPSTPAAGSALALPFTGSASTPAGFLFTVQQTGAGSAAEFTTGGAGTGVRGRTGTGAGVFGSALAAPGVGVRAEHLSTAGTALEITRGAIRVAGAGRDTPTAAFYITVFAQGGTNYVTLDHPMLNGDPKATVFVTRDAGYEGAYEGTERPYYDSGLNRWRLKYTVAGTSGFLPGFNFKFLIIKS